eukprot:GHUV01026322.1.p1 GENE.GHUV01026322.1~~GHUV01026322.1.p1  ORF type:complete len:413 (+),score=173.87 GHUV01026322.1:652-1890(+)
MSLDKHQLARLHGVLGPFMLRRIKADVVAEMVPKTEIMLRCRLSRRQAQLYAALRKNLTLQDLVAMGAKAGGGPGPSGAASSRLMGLIMQMRKVCNHPELLEGQAERWPFTFAAITTAHNPELTEPPVPAGPGRPPKQRVVPWVQVTGFSSHLQVTLPRRLYNDGLMGNAAAVLGGHLEGARQLWLNQRMQLFTASNAHQLLQGVQQISRGKQQTTQQEHKQKQLGEDDGAVPQPYSNGPVPLSSSNRTVWGFQQDMCFNNGFSFSVFCCTSPSQLAAAAAGDIFQKWELSYATRRGAAAAEAWQQRWQEYGIDEQQWQQQVLQLRRQQQQSIKQESVPKAEAPQQQQYSTSNAAGLFGSRVQVVAQQQHDQVQQQLLLLPPRVVMYQRTSRQQQSWGSMLMSQTVRLTQQR